MQATQQAFWKPGEAAPGKRFDLLFHDPPCCTCLCRSSLPHCILTASRQYNPPPCFAGGLQAEREERGQAEADAIPYNRSSRPISSSLALYISPWREILALYRYRCPKRSVLLQILIPPPFPTPTIDLTRFLAVVTHCPLLTVVTRFGSMPLSRQRARLPVFKVGTSSSSSLSSSLSSSSLRLHTTLLPPHIHMPAHLSSSRKGTTVCSLGFSCTLSFFWSRQLICSSSVLSFSLLFSIVNKYFTC